MPNLPNKAIIDLVYEASEKYNVEPALILAHMKRESDFRPTAYREEPKINDASVGLMQVLVKTAQWIMNDKTITKEKLFDPRFNIEVGAKYIRYQLDRYDGDIKKAIAAYNAGSARYTKDGRFINQPYVDYVYNKYLEYKKLFPPKKDNLVIAALLIGAALLV